VGDKTYNSRDVAKLAKVSFRQLQWWDERGQVSPTIDKGSRQYRSDQVIAVLCLAELRRKGLSFQAIRRVWPELRAKIAIASLGKSPEDAYLVTDGKRYSTVQYGGNMLTCIKAAKTPLWVVSITDQAQRLAKLQARAA
jgi:DNA-binding transcriptional MerR regulator